MRNIEEIFGGVVENPSQKPWTYIATGLETQEPDGTYSIPIPFVFSTMLCFNNGNLQTEAQVWADSTKIYFIDQLEEGDTLFFLFNSSMSVDRIKAGNISEYKFVVPQGGLESFVVDRKFDHIIVTINGATQANEITCSVVGQTVYPAVALEEDDLVYCLLIQGELDNDDKITNLEAVSRDYKVSVNEVVIGRQETPLDGVKVLFDPIEQTGWLIPDCKGEKIVAFNPPMLKTDKQEIDLTQFNIDRNNFFLKSQYSFEKGFTLQHGLQTVIFEGQEYRWGGGFPHHMAEEGVIGKGWIPLRTSVFPLHKIGVQVPDGTTVVKINNNIYPLNMPCSGVVQTINILTKPYHIIVDGEKYILKDATKRQNTVESYWAVSDYFLEDGSLNPSPTDNTPMLQAAWDYHVGDLHYTKGGNYFVKISPDGLTCIQPKSNYLTTVYGNNSKTFLETNNKRSYKIYDFQFSLPVVVNDLIVEGDVETHIPNIVNGDKGGEWGHGFDLTCAKHITLNRCWANRCWGDGFYLGSDTVSIPQNIILTDCGGDSNRRQGLSGIAGQCKIVRFHGKNTGQIIGVEPMAGMDIEPNSTSIADLDYQIIDPVFENNRGGGLQIIMAAAFDSPTLNESGKVNCRVLVSNMTSINDGKIDRGAIRIGGYIPNLEGNKLEGFINFVGVTTVQNSFSDALQLSNFTDKYPNLLIENLNTINVYSGYDSIPNYGTTTCIISTDFQQQTIDNPLFKFGNVDIQNWSYHDTRGETWSSTPTLSHHRVKRPIFWRYFSPFDTLTGENFKIGNINFNIQIDDWNLFYNGDIMPKARVYGRKLSKETRGNMVSTQTMFLNGLDIVLNSDSSTSLVVNLPKPGIRDIGCEFSCCLGDKHPNRLVFDVKDGVELLDQSGKSLLTDKRYEPSFIYRVYNFKVVKENTLMLF